MKRTSWPRACLTAAAVSVALASCHTSQDRYPRDDAALADTLGAIMSKAYEVAPGTPDSAVERQLVAIYADTGPVISASAGRMTTTRDSVDAELRWFWEHIGRNMQDPHFEWVAKRARRLAPGIALFTGEYRIPHRTPTGRPHVVGGAWTALFEQRGGLWQITAEHLSDLPVQAEDTAAKEMMTP